MLSKTIDFNVILFDCLISQDLKYAMFSIISFAPYGL
jgi:hypothetical protein